jgi:hypothetical protein
VVPRLSGRDWPVFDLSLSPSSLQHDLALRYFFDRYRWAHCWKTVLLDALQTHPNSIQHTSVKALVLGYVGYKERRPELQRKSTEIYGEIIPQVRTTLQHSTLSSRADVTWTVLILAIYPVSLHSSHLNTVLYAD